MSCCRGGSTVFDLLVRGILIGLGATLVLDAWIGLLKLAFGLPSRNWAMVGRWVGPFAGGRFVHESIAQAPPIRGELALGWAFHHLFGTAYGMLLVSITGAGWVRHPTLLPAMVISFVGLPAPYFVMDPAMGAGFAASRAPHPAAARLRSLMNHAVFGAGLYASAWLAYRVYS